MYLAILLFLLMERRHNSALKLLKISWLRRNPKVVISSTNVRSLKGTAMANDTAEAMKAISNLSEINNGFHTHFHRPHNLRDSYSCGDYVHVRASLK